MSFSALYEYMRGEFQDVTRVPLAAAGVDPAWIIDPNGVKIAGHQIELWDADAGGTQLLEGVDYSLVFLDSGKTAAEGVDIWAGYQVINVAYQGIPLYLNMRVIGGYTKFSAVEAQESPPFGARLDSGELFLDGTDSYTSSDNRSPVVDVVDYIPAVRTIDGIDYEPDELKFSGKGTYGMFGDYENVLATATETLDNVTKTEEGSWTKITQVTTGALGAVNYNYPALTTSGYFTVIMRRGDDAGIDDVIELSSGYCSVTWPTGTFSFTDLTDLGSFVIGGNIAVFKFTTQITGETKLNIRASGIGLEPSIEYSYFMNAMVVDIDYPVPYTPGTHEANKIQYNLDWATSDEWTIEGWFNHTAEGQAANYIVSTRLLTSDDYFVLRVNAVGGLQLVSGSGGNVTATELTGQVTNQYNHFKLVVNSATSIGVYVNGGALQNVTANIPNTSLCTKILDVGVYYDEPLGYQLTGYIQDVVIKPVADTSDAHYLSGLPYYNPDKTYGKNALWSIDDKGHFSGQFDNGGRIVLDARIGGAWVTRWDTGLEINGGVIGRWK